MRCLILKLQGPKLEKCRSYGTKRYINYNDALLPNILVVGGAAKFEVDRSNSFWFIMSHRIRLQMDGQTDGQTHRWTDPITIYHNVGGV